MDGNGHAARMIAALILLAGLLAAGCGETTNFDSSSAPGSNTQSSSLHVADSDKQDAAEPPSQTAERSRIPLMNHLQLQLDQLEEPPEDLAEWLHRVTAGYDSWNEPIEAAPAHYDPDERRNEWLTVLKEDVWDHAAGEISYRKAYGVYITYDGSKFQIQSFDFPEDSYGKARLETLADLNGDGTPEAVWISFSAGAHTTLAMLSISVRDEGTLVHRTNVAEMANLSGIEVHEGKLLMTGGLIGSVGAGSWQREYTESYAWQDGTLTLADRTYAESPTPYHLLIDGLWSEALGHEERALQQFREAANKTAASYDGYSFIIDGEWTEGNAIDSDWQQQFERTIHQFARLREHLLALRSKGESIETACPKALESARYSDSWLVYLNAPAGYANPSWDNERLCDIYAKEREQ